MSEDLPSDNADLSLPAQERIDRICLAFENAWTAGEQPRVESYLGEAPELERTELLRQLLRLESYYRRRAGEPPSAEEYAARFPGHPQVVAEILKAVVTCPGCAKQIPDLSRRCPYCGAALASRAAPAGGDARGICGQRAGRPSPPRWDAAGKDRFLPGTLLAGRYRIVCFLGRGGMGDVYRADDLKLGQPVALKFLPPRLAADPQLLEYFHNEVRLARQVAHPNVCPVYDIGEVNEQHFLSMEYIDGEDLARLLRRIGRLPVAKAVALAQQLFAGLAAAHDKAILHRDLKPANVMLDSRGQARITDFGLACWSDLPTDEEFLVGTPLYMAPEQLAGRPATVRSDIYALGLVLYEMLTGTTPFRAHSRAGPVRVREESLPVAPSHLVEGLDPAVERVLLQCLERDPGERPSSARAVLAALPGADPLEAALAAGQTPSPEMVAAAGEVGGLHPAVGTCCLAAVLLGLFLVTLLSGPTTLVGQVDVKPPDVLAERAKNILDDHAGPRPANADCVWGFAYATDPRDLAPVYFWYRRSPVALEPELMVGGVSAKGNGIATLDDPRPVPGEVQVRLGPQGRLLEFRALPQLFDERDSGSRSAEVPTPETGVPAWYTGFFRQAELIGEEEELDPHRFRVSRATRGGPDGLYDWIGICPQTQTPIRIEAQCLRGQVIHFRVLREGSQGPLREGLRLPLYLEPVIALLLLLMLIAAAVLARRNLRRGRGDRRGANRLAVYVFLVAELTWLLGTSRGGMPPSRSLLFVGLQVCLFWSAALWLFYLALEPYARRLWPETLVSWNRLLAGKIRDPHVGRDLLVGALFAVATRLLWQLNILVPTWCQLEAPELFGPERPFFEVALQPLLGARHCMAVFLYYQARATVGGLTVLLLLVLLRFVLRKPWLAAGGHVLIVTAVLTLGLGHPETSWLAAALSAVLVFWLLMRFGLLAVANYVLVRDLLSYPLTLDLGAWHAANTTVFPLSLILALTVYGYCTSLAGRPLWRDAIFHN